MAGHTPRTAVHRHTGSYDKHGNHNNLQEDEAVRRLAAVILLQTVSDWISLLHEEKRQQEGKRVAYPSQYTSYKDIDLFVRGSLLGRVCCGIVDIEPDIIMERMKKWKTTFDRTGKIPTQVFKTGLVESVVTDNERSSIRVRDYDRWWRLQQRPPCRYEQELEAKT